jgi:hypothetical protein
VGWRLPCINVDLNPRMPVFSRSDMATPPQVDCFRVADNALLARLNIQTIYSESMMQIRVKGVNTAKWRRTAQRKLA